MTKFAFDFCDFLPGLGFQFLKVILLTLHAADFLTNGQLNDKERLYDGYLLDYKDDDKDDHSLTEKWKSLIPMLTALCTWREELRE